MYFSFNTEKIPFHLVLWSGRTLSLQFPCYYSLKRRTCPSVMAEHLYDLQVHISNSSEMVVSAFTLQKENLETLEAISFLAAELGVLPSDFSYTGIKDKKAITYQPMVVKKVTPERYLQSGCIQFSTYFCMLISINMVQSSEMFLMDVSSRVLQHSGNVFNILWL